MLESTLGKNLSLAKSVADPQIPKQISTGIFVISTKLLTMLPIMLLHAVINDMQLQMSCELQSVAAVYSCLEYK